MKINLSDEQKDVINRLRSGSILCGGAGSGKSRTALAYFFIKEGHGNIDFDTGDILSLMQKPKNLYIITTAMKRDRLEWDPECAMFLLFKDFDGCKTNKLVIDSWNNIFKYVNVKDSFFIFDEQRVIGYGAWVKSFLKIVKFNNWILLSATPGDTWSDYIPTFIANNFYRNRSDFLREHAVYNRFSKYPKIDKYINVEKLIKYRNLIVINMEYPKKTIIHIKNVVAPYNLDEFNTLLLKRWNFYENRPIKDVGELCFLMRKVVNSDSRRLSYISEILLKHPKVIIFYNFNYELDILSKFCNDNNITFSQWNGHKHDPLPIASQWVYLVQYSAGAEGWNCIETNAMIFFSQNYSYRAMVQAMGRIDRLNTPFTDLYYYYLISHSVIDLSIQKALKNKKDFNEYRFLNL